MMDDALREFQDEYPRFRTLLNEAQAVILDSAVSDYPVFVFSKDLPELGVQLYESRDPVSDWFVHASSLEEMVVKKVEAATKVDDIKEIYKDPKIHFCILLLHKESAHFAFPQKQDIPFSDNRRWKTADS